MKLYSRRIIGFIIFGIGAILTILLLQTLWSDLPVWFFGRQVSATIVKKWWEDLYDDEMNPVYFFGYEFTADNGEVYTGSSRVPDSEWISYSEGREIKVKYSPLNPADNRLDDSRFIPYLICSYIPFILICWFSLTAGREMIDM